MVVSTASSSGGVPWSRDRSQSCEEGFGGVERGPQTSENNFDLLLPPKFLPKKSTRLGEIRGLFYMGVLVCTVVQ